MSFSIDLKCTFFTLQFQYSFHFVRDKRAFFAFEDDGTGFQRLKSMPHVFGDVNTIHAIVMDQDNTFNNTSIVIVCC